MPGRPRGRLTLRFRLREVATRANSFIPPTGAHVTNLHVLVASYLVNDGVDEQEKAAAAVGNRRDLLNFAHRLCTSWVARRR